jgi:hypothetical protein
MVTKFTPHQYVPRHDKCILMFTDAILFVMVHSFTSFGTWSHDWDDPIDSLWLQSQLMMLLFELYLRHTYLQLNRPQLNIPEAQYFALCAIYGVRFYSGLFLSFMALSRLNADVYSHPAIQQSWLSLALVLFIVVRIVDEWGLFDGCRHHQLEAVSIQCDPRTAQRDTSASYDGSILTHRIPGHKNVVHVTEVGDNGAQTYSIQTPSQFMVPKTADCVSTKQCRKCLDPSYCGTERLCVTHRSLEHARGTKQE